MNQQVLEIFNSGIHAVNVNLLIDKYLSMNDKELIIGDLKFSLSDVKHIYVVGAGKASGQMALKAEQILGDRISDGYVIVKYGQTFNSKNINIAEASHPIPDLNGVNAANEILKIVAQANTHDLIICLWSGGASALMADYPEGISLSEMASLNSLLINSGASIYEINAVRKHLSSLKGGQLAKLASPATVVSLILSDVIGDTLDVIASGPTVPDSTTFANALWVIEKYELQMQISETIINYIKAGEVGDIVETPKLGEVYFNQAFNYIIGNNSIALEVAHHKAESLGFNSFIVTSTLEGDNVEAAEYIIETALNVQNDTSIKKPVCLLFGGETTLRVTTLGIGGRNQHLALFAAMLLKDKPGITLLSAGTDGTDGPTDAAGAMVNFETLHKALKQGIDPVKMFRDFNSYDFFQQVGGHIKTGPTGTNVMDMVVVVVV